MAKARKGILWVTVLDHGVDTRYARVPHAHVTLAFGVREDEPVVVENVGKTVLVTLVEECWNTDIQAISVRLDRVESRNAKPHITVSHCEGVKPKQSNDMLAGAHTKDRIGRTIQGVVEFKPF